MPFEVVAGKRCGPFELGMSLFTALNILKSNEFGALKTAITYSRLHPIDSPVIVDVKSLGIRLRFESQYQTLFVVEAYDFNLVSVSFNKQLVLGRNSGDANKTLKALYPVLGATHAGVRRKELGRDAFCFQYPGFLIQFAVPEHEIFQGIPFVLQSTSKSPELSRFFIHHVDFPKQISPKRGTDVDVTLKREGLHFAFNKFAKLMLCLDSTTCQDVLSVLGSPNATFFRRREAFASGMERNMELSMDYYYNYFELGMDLLFDGKRHVVKQVVLRTNLVPHAHFSFYAKCSFAIKLGTKVGKRSVLSASSPAPNVVAAAKPSTSHHLLPQSFEDLLMGISSASASQPPPAPPPPKPKPATQDSERTISCDEKWPLIANKLDLQNEQPMVHEPPEQPFGACLLYTIPHFVFEIDLQSQHLISVTLS